jgi:hypothetical protein
MDLKRFHLGQIIIMPNANDQLETGEIRQALRRHARGDWGELRPQEILENDRALRDGCHLFSLYRDRLERTFCIVTAADRSMTVVSGFEEH